MRKLTTKILASVLMVFGLLFGSLIFPTSTSLNPLVQNAYADEEDELDTTETLDNETSDEESPDGEPSDDESSETDPTPPQSPDNPELTTDGESDPDSPSHELTEDEIKDACQEQTGSLSWIVCPTTGVIAKAVDGIYNSVSELLIVAPLSTESNSPIYLIWQYARSITNIVFAILLIIVILSQITGVGINNYGIKRVLPRLIIAIILVNLSFVICTLAVDASNIIGHSLRGFLEGIQNKVLSSETVNTVANVNTAELLQVIIGGGAIGGVAISAIGGTGYIFFMLLTVLFGALIAVVSGLITISARQALVALLVMISPLAFVAYLLPNTEPWFKRWRSLLTRMLVFYPLFSFLFGASQLVGWVLISSATNSFGIILGIAVEIFPLFFSWSLMKMSGTILGNINSGIRRAAQPLQRSLSDWSKSHAEHQRQVYLSNPTHTGTRLRTYLDSRRKLRELDTHNASDIREARATENALYQASSNTGLDEHGRMTWRRRANRYTATAKLASMHNMRLDTARSSYNTTLGSYGRHFADSVADQHLANAHGYIAGNAMAQQYLAQNEAESDQKDLLDLYLKTSADSDIRSYEYERLIGNAAGGLGINGESSIMGQVIVGNSTIENRRRAEARIMINKFGYDKVAYRGMVFDKRFIDDDGYVTDAEGNAIEDSQHRLLPGQHYEEWHKYIGEHKITKQIITKEQYDNLSETERANYNKVRFIDITNDKGDITGRVFENDAGYMKELLRDDIAIGDPINRRYAIEIGVNEHNKDQTGILRRYHSTISAALTDYSGHSGDFTAMLTQQANNGYILSAGHLNIASFDSLSKAAKAKNIITTDQPIIDQWSDIIESIDDDELFSFYFPDEDIMSYRNINGLHLNGLRLITDPATGKKRWEKVSRYDIDRMSDKKEALELRKNFIKHQIIADGAQQLFTALDRNISQGALDGQKKNTLKALSHLMDVLEKVGLDNINPDKPFDKKLNGTTDNIYNTPNSSMLRARARATRDAILNEIKRQNGQSSIDADTDTPTNSSSSNEKVEELLQQLTRARVSKEQFDNRNDIANVLQAVENICTSGTNYESVAGLLYAYLDEVESMDDFMDNVDDLIIAHRADNLPTDKAEGIHQNAHLEEDSIQRIERLHKDVQDLILGCFK